MISNIAVSYLLPLEYWSKWLFSAFTKNISKLRTIVKKSEHEIWINQILLWCNLRFTVTNFRLIFVEHSNVDLPLIQSVKRLLFYFIKSYPLIEVVKTKLVNSEYQISPGRRMISRKSASTFNAISRKQIPMKIEVTY